MYTVPETSSCTPTRTRPGYFVLYPVPDFVLYPSRRLRPVPRLRDLVLYPAGDFDPYLVLEASSRITTGVFIPYSVLNVFSLLALNKFGCCFRSSLLFLDVSFNVETCKPSASGGGFLQSFCVEPLHHFS